MPSISHVSDNLLEDLTTARRDNESRPLLFVGHSLGGIVIKDTLIRSSQYQNTGGNARLGSIYQSTVGIVFFGTPHHGSFEAPLERIVTNILQDSNPAKRIVRPVNPEFFEQQAMNFREIAETLPTVDIFELHHTHTINGSKLVCLILQIGNSCHNNVARLCLRALRFKQCHLREDLVYTNLTSNSPSFRVSTIMGIEQVQHI
jgi:hypothetical protein